MRVRLWFPEAETAGAEETDRSVEVEMPALPREGEIISFDDLRPDDVFRVASIWWNLSTSGRAGVAPGTGMVTEVSVHLVFDEEMTSALQDVAQEGEPGQPGEIDWANVVRLGDRPKP
jgi:hypothetical protein